MELVSETISFTLPFQSCSGYSEQLLIMLTQILTMIL